MSRIRGLLLFAAFLAGPPAAAQGVAERPDWKPGDTWSFERRTEPDGTVDRWSRTIISVLPEGGYEVMAGANSQWRTDPDLNALSALGAEYNTKWWRWPLRIGDQ